MDPSKKKVTPEVEPVVIPKFSFAALEKMLETMTEPEFLKYTEKGNSPRNIPHLDLLYTMKVDKATGGPKAFVATEYMFGRTIYLQRSGKNLDPLYVCWKVTHKKHHRYTEGPTPRIPFADYPARTDLNELSAFEMYEQLPYVPKGINYRLLTGGMSTFKKIEKENPKLAIEVIEHCLSQITVDNFIVGYDREPNLPYLKIEKFHTKEFIPGDSTTTEYTFAEDIGITGNLKAGYLDTMPCWVVTYKKHENPFCLKTHTETDRSHLNELSDFYRCERRTEEGDKWPTYHKISKL